MSIAPKKYYSQLDGLRAISVLAVIFTHSMSEEVLHWLRPGIAGVRLFFVISGFLITGILLDAKQKYKAQFDQQREHRRQVLFAFYARRFLRIFPIYYLFIAVAYWAPVPEVRDYITWHLLYLSNISTAIRGAFPPFTGHLWSLAVEEQFYLFWPFVILFIRSSRLSFCLWSMIVAAPVFRYITLYHMGSVASGVLTPNCLDTLAVGALLAYYQRFPNPKVMGWIGSKTTMNIALGCTSTLCVAAGLSTAYVLRHVFIDTGMAFLFGCLVLRVSSGIPWVIGVILDSSTLRYVGTISYGMYLYHLAIAQLVREVCGIPSGWLCFILATLATIALASCSWLVIERPLNRLKKYFPYFSPSGVLANA